MRQPEGKNIILNEVDLLRLEFMHRHGDLPTPFIYEYTKDKAKSLQATQVRLKSLFHESRHLDRPPQQLKTEKPDNKYMVHRVSKKGIEELKRHCRYRDNTPKGSSSWDHDFLRACYTASIELACRENPQDYRYIHHDTIVNNAIKKTGKHPTFKSGKEVFNPDAMFGIQYKKQNSLRLFAVEVDMMTESIQSQTQRTKTIEQSLNQYRNFIKEGKYKQMFPPVDGFMLVTVTINHTHAENMMEAAKNEPFFLFNWIPNFEYFVTPPAPMPWLFYEPYDRPGHEPFSLANP